MGLIVANQSSLKLRINLYSCSESSFIQIAHTSVHRDIHLPHTGNL